jgi:hypothetical protein
MHYQLLKNDIIITRPLLVKDLVERVIKEKEISILQMDGYRIKGLR